MSFNKTTKTISNKETALLMLLSEKPMHAYKIEREIESRAMREWTEISTSSIYKLLRKMEKSGFVKSEIKLSKNNISQKVYSLTSSGKKALKKKLLALISEPERIIHRIDLAISHLNQLSKEEALKGLRNYLKKLQENINGYKNLENYLIEHNCPKHSLSLARRPQYLIKADIEWVNEYIKQLKEQLN